MNWEQIVAFLREQGVTDVPVDLTDPRLTAEKLGELIASVKGTYRTARAEGKPLAEARKLADAINAVQAQIDERAEAAKLDAAVDKVGDPDPDDADDGDDATDKSLAAQVAADGTTPLTTDTPLLVPDATTGDGTLTDDDKASMAVATAAAAALAAGGGTQSDNDQTGGTGTNSGDRRPLVAAATLGGVEFGHEVTLNELARIIPEVTSQFRAGMPSLRDGGVERRVQVASALGYADRPEHDDSLVLSMDKTATMNTAIIRKALADHTQAVKAAKEGAPMTAATFCAPFDVIREIPDATDTSQPFRDSLAFVPFGHGGFTFNAGVQFADVAGAVNVWTETEQDAVDANDDSTWKPVYEIVCPTPTTLRADDWITAGVTWKVGMDINNPENVADVFKKVEGNRARVTEQYFLGMIDPLLTNYHFLTTSAVESSIPDLIAALVASFSHAGYDHRLRDDISYTMYLDTGVLGNLVVDRVRSAFGVGREQEGVMSYLMSVFNEAELPIDRMVQLKERQAANTQLGKGWSYGAQKSNGNPYSGATYPPAADGAMVDGPDLLTKFRIRLVPTSEVFAFGTGEIRTGVRQDFAMARQNMLGWFVEEAVKLGKFGVSPWFALNIDLCPSGARVGWVDPADVNCGATLGS